MSAPQEQHNRPAQLHLGMTPWDLGSTLTARHIARQAVCAEEMGYQSFWLPENHFVEVPGKGNALPEPLMLLAAAAAVTSRIQLGTTSLLLPVRNPIQTAEQVAVLDVLSEGRLILGLGRGYQPVMFRAFGVAAKEKRTRFEHCLNQMQAAWRGEPVAGEDFAAVLSPMPQQQPHPPIWLAAFGPKALEQAGRLGFPYLASPMEPLPVLETNYRRLAEASAAAGQEPSPIIPLMRTVFVSEDRALLARVQEQLLQGEQAVSALARASQSDYTITDWTIIGTPDEVQRQIEDYQQRLGMTHLVATRLRQRAVAEDDLIRSLELLAHIVGVSRPADR